MLGGTKKHVLASTHTWILGCQLPHRLMPQTPLLAQELPPSTQSKDLDMHVGKVGDKHTAWPQEAGMTELSLPQGTLGRCLWRQASCPLPLQLPHISCNRVPEKPPHTVLRAFDLLAPLLRLLFPEYFPLLPLRTVLCLLSPEHL